MIWAYVKRLFRIRLRLQKVERTLHQNEGSFGGQVSGQLLRQAHQSECVLDGFPHVTPEKQGNALASETISEETSRPQAMPMDCKHERNILRDTYAVAIDPDTEI